MSIDEVKPEEWDRAFRNHYAAPVNFSSDCSGPDLVQKPPHYNNGSIEAIDYIKQQLGEKYVGYLEGNVLKYIHRYKYKNGVEDLRKAEWYLKRLIREMVQ